MQYMGNTIVLVDAVLYRSAGQVMNNLPSTFFHQSDPVFAQVVSQSVLDQVFLLKLMDR